MSFESSSYSSSRSTTDNERIPTVADYAFESSVGEGSYGKIKRAKSRLDGQTYAVKFMKINEEEDLEFALSEIGFMAQLVHPYIVKYQEACWDNDAVVIAMEFAEGGDLHKKIREARDGRIQWDERTIRKYFVQICLAVKHMHDKDIAHRDLKPMNVFLDAAGNVRLGDFGIAARLPESNYDRGFVGSPFYCSPEILNNEYHCRNTDMWSLGVILYEMITRGVLPYEGESDESLRRNVNSNHFAALPNTVSEGLRNLCYRLLSRQPSHRPTIDEVLSSSPMQEALDELPINQQALFTRSGALYSNDRPTANSLRAAGEFHIAMIKYDVKSHTFRARGGRNQARKVQNVARAAPVYKRVVSPNVSVISETIIHTQPWVAMVQPAALAYGAPNYNVWAY